MILLPSSIDRPISPDASLPKPFSICTCARWISPNSSGPSIVTVHSIAASLKLAIFMKRSWLRFPIPRHPRLFAGFKLTAHQMREAIKRRDTKGEPVREIARTYNVSHSTISRVKA